MKYRHSVWMDVAGVVALLAALIGPLLYLAVEASEGAGGTSPIGTASGTPDRAPQYSARQSSRPIGGGSVAATESSAPSPSSVARAPFSPAWRDRATPDLSVGAPNSSSPPLAARSPSATEGSPSPPTPNLGGPAPSRSGAGPARNGGRDWTAAARRLQGRATALSRQLGQMSRNPSSPESSSERTGSPTSSDGPAPTGTSSDPPLPGDDPTVPIDDHLPWLAVAGLLWGSWRLMRG